MILANSKRQSLIAIVLVGWLAALPALAAPSHAELLTDAQAADVLSDLLTWSTGRASARAESLQNYLKEIGKFDAFNALPKPPATAAPTPATAPASTPRAMFYDQLFTGAVQFVQQGGDKYADPAFGKLTNVQLSQELTALQHYNIPQFLELNRERAYIAAMKAYLVSMNELPAYTDWAAKHGDSVIAQAGQAAGTAGGQAAGASPEQAVANYEDLMQAARDAAFKRAQAAGVSESDFDKQWDQKKAALKSDISQRMEGTSALAAAFAKTASAPPSPKTGAGGAARSPAADGNEGFFQPQPFGDPFTTTYEGPGEYGAYDSRVNVFNDQRVNEEYDRRANLTFDRRTNIQLNIRQGK